jgi:peptide-methionine (S)-S-oxide reductase
MFVLDMYNNKLKMPQPGAALKGRAEPIVSGLRHFVNGASLHPPFARGLHKAMFGLGCFWGAEKKFWQQQGVAVTAVGYAAGFTPNPTYQEVCTGLTGHNEVVLVAFDPKAVSYEALLALFFESHDPTQGMRQGGDIGTQYRSGIYWFDEAQKAAAEAARETYGRALAAAGHKATITTEILPAPGFYYAEEYHQQYLAKNPHGYCGLGGTGVACPIGTGVKARA